MRKIALLLCLCLLFGMAAGCTGEDAYVPTGHGLAGQEPVQPPVTQPQEPENPETPTKPVSRDGFTLAYYEDEGFNPYTCASFQNRMVFSLLYQGLFSVDRDYRPVPILCKSYTVSEDLMEHTFELEDAVFSDGTAMTVDDVVKSLHAAQENSYYRGRFDGINAMYALSDGTLRIETDTAYENLPLLLDVPIVKADQLEADMPVGTGPYFLVETPSGLNMKRQPNWWCEASLPLSSESILLQPFQSPARIRDGFEFDSVGISISDPGAASYAEYRCDYELWEAETGIFLYLATNGASPVFSHSKVREALTFAVDRYELLEKCYHGFGAVATLPASPGSPIYDRGLASKVSFQPERFKQAVEDAGLVGQKVVMLVNKTDSVRLQTARMIAETLTDCGLVVEMLEEGGYRYGEKLKTDEWDLYLGQTKLSPNMDLTAFFDSDGSMSYGDMDDETAYEMALEALENSGNFYNLHQLVLQDGQLVPILFRTYAIYARRGLAESLQPARDNVFFYTLGKALEDITTVVASE